MFFTVVLAFSIPLCSNYSILIKPSNTTKYVSLLSLLQSNKDNKDTYFVVFDSFISIL